MAPGSKPDAKWPSDFQQTTKYVSFFLSPDPLLHPSCPSLIQFTIIKKIKEGVISYFLLSDDASCLSGQSRSLHKKKQKKNNLDASNNFSFFSLNSLGVYLSKTTFFVFFKLQNFFRRYQDFEQLYNWKLDNQ